MRHRNQWLVPWLTLLGVPLSGCLDRNPDFSIRGAGELTQETWTVSSASALSSGLRTYSGDACGLAPSGCQWQTQHSGSLTTWSSDAASSSETEGDPPSPISPTSEQGSSGGSSLSADESSSSEQASSSQEGSSSQVSSSTDTTSDPDACEPELCLVHNDGEEATSQSNNEGLQGFRFEFNAQSRRVARFEVYTGQRSGDVQFQIYSDSGNRPDSRLLEQDWMMSEQVEWQGADLDPPFEAQENVGYWMTWDPIPSSQASIASSGPDVFMRFRQGSDPAWLSIRLRFKVRVYCCK